MTLSAFSTCAAGVVWIVGGSMCPAPAHDIGKVHEVGGRRGRRWLLGNGSGNGGSEIRVLVGRCESRRRHGCDGVGAVVASQLGGDSHLVMSIVATEVGLESVECFGSRVKAPVATGIVE